MFPSSIHESSREDATEQSSLLREAGAEAGAVEGDGCGRGDVPTTEKSSKAEKQKSSNPRPRKAAKQKSSKYYEANKIKESSSSNGRQQQSHLKVLAVLAIPKAPEIPKIPETTEISKAQDQDRDQAITNLPALRPPLQKQKPPPPPSVSASTASTAAEDVTEHDQRSDERKTRFRFKKKSRREGAASTSTSRTSQTSWTSSTSSSAPKRHKTYHTSIDLDDDPSLYDDSYIPNSAAWQRAPNPDAAFMESLFDAMADDEGAQFWEGVYGQPIHEYERPMKQDERGELERMTDEEYARYVRERMWEKSHEYVEQERRRREEDRTKRRQREREEQEEWEREERKRRQEIKRRKERMERERFRDAWRDYLRYWESGSSKVEDIPWPVASGRVKDVVREKVEEFMLAAPGEEEITDVLKRERVRWHPDKAQQRWGLDALTKTEMEAITMVFQTVDALWAEYKGKRKSS
ncbi:hypothetical protein BZA77DRAFT_356645 [Pyronema omphalodes]|nr:hypothetical protein BZA77DRAFT_356645 [Pyronema omphalodes]